MGGGFNWVAALGDRRGRRQDDWVAPDGPDAGDIGEQSAEGPGDAEETPSWASVDDGLRWRL